MNGLDPSGLLLAGTVIKLPTGAPAPPRAVAARAGRDRRPAGRPRADRDPPRRRRRPVRRRRSTASLPRWRPRSPGRRAASTTRWSRAPTRAASCRSCPARGTTCSRTSPTRQLDPNSAHDNVTAGVLYLKQPAEPDRRRRDRGDRRLLPGPGRAALARRVRRHEAVRRERAGAARSASAAEVSRYWSATRSSRRGPILLPWSSWPRPSAPRDLIFLLSQAAHALQTEMTAELEKVGDHAALVLRAHQGAGGREHADTSSPSAARSTRPRWSSRWTSSNGAGSPSAAPPPPTGARASSR